LALVCAAEGTFDAFKKLSLGKPKEDKLTLKETGEAKSDLVGTPQCKAKAFVINLHKRRDRCICMSNQLKSAPFKAERFNAVAFSDPRTEEKKFVTKDQATGRKITDPVQKAAAVPGTTYQEWTPVTAEDMKDSQLCDGAFRNGVVGGTHSVLSEMALFCSHLQLWKKLEKEPEDAFIVMEDDLPMSPKIWEKLDHFVKTYKGKWDMVQVDSYGKEGHEMPAADKVDEFEGAPIYKPSESGQYWGGHMFILRKSALPKMLYRMKGMQSEPVDWLPRHWSNTSIAVRTVQFGLINFIDEEKKNEYYKQSDCGQYVDMSDINFSGKRAVGNKGTFQRGMRADNKGALECPAQEDKKKNALKKK